MKRFVYKLSFIPRFPHNHANNEGSFVEEGSYFLISSKKLLIGDFKVNDSPIADDCRIHVSRSFESFINPEQEQYISITHSHITSHLTYSFTRQPFVENDLYILPIMQLKDKSDWDSTLLWTKMFIRPPILSTIYTDLLLKYDKKNSGAKLKSYFVSNGNFVNNFLKFVTNLDVPINDFVKNNQQVITTSMPNSQVIGIYSAFRFLGFLIDRVVRADTNNTKYYMITGVAFNKSITNLSSEYLEQFRRNSDVKFDTGNPLIEVVQINTSSKQILNNYQQSLEYPNAVSPRHQRIIELLEDKGMIEAVWQRIPQDYAPPDNHITYIPLEVAFLPPYPKSAMAMLHLFNKITDQFKSIAPSLPTIQSITFDAMETIKVHTGYPFQNALLLRSALTDQSLDRCKSGILEGNEKLSFIGDIIIQLIVSTAIYGAITYQTTSDYNKIFVQMTGLNFLGNLAVLMDIEKNYISTSSEKLVVGSKKLKDMFCAIFGAIFLDSSLSKCFKAFRSLFHRHASFVEPYLKNYINGQSVFQYIDENFSPKLTCRSPQPSDVSITQEILDQTLQFDTKELSSQFFQVALTPPGCGPTSNESFAFIGRAILKFTYMIYTNAAFKPVSKEKLEHVVRSYLSKSDEFSVQIGLNNILIVAPEYQHIHISSPDELKSIPDELRVTYAEGFEAIIGCMAATDDLSSAFQFIEQRIIGNQWIITPNDYKYGYIEELKQLVDDKFKNETNKQTHEIVYTTMSGNGYFLTVISIGDKQLPYIGKAPDQMVARYEVAKKAVDAILANSDLIITKEEISEETDVKYFLFSQC